MNNETVEAIKLPVQLRINDIADAEGDIICWSGANWNVIGQQICTAINSHADLTARLATVEAEAKGLRDALSGLPKEVPTTWLDPVLTGDNSVFKQTEKWDARDIEALLRGVQDRLRAKAQAALAGKENEG